MLRRLPVIEGRICMNNVKNIVSAFENGKAFIPFITAGDPDLETTEKLIIAMAEAGADLIEIGIPFSDPIAEGTTISSASLRALNGGTTCEKIFESLKHVRKTCDVPLVFMTYANVVFGYGTEKFLTACNDCGVCGVILPDVPFEEKDEFAAAFKMHGVELVSLIAPTSNDRIAIIAKEAEGFVYCVSSLGVTGVRTEITTNVGEMVRLVKTANPEIPCAIGFGISTPEQAAKMAALSDGVIVGSAIVKLIEKYGSDCVDIVSDYVKNMKTAIS